jgi:hypothetical protein
MRQPTIHQTREEKKIIEEKSRKSKRYSILANRLEYMINNFIIILRKRYMHVRVFTTIGEDHYHHHYIVYDTLISIQSSHFR